MRSRRLVPRVVHPALAPFVDLGILGTAEVHAALHIAGAGLGDAGPADHEFLALAFAVWSINRSHVCLDLSDIEAQVITEVAPFAGEDLLRTMSDLPWPTNLEDALQSSALVSVVGPAGSASPSPDRPLVLKGNLLYLMRQWVDEGIVADLLAGRLASPPDHLGPSADAWARAAFRNPDDCPEQVAAVRNVLAHRLSVLLGGPGTGKTFTIAAMLHALAERRAHEGGRPLRVALAAPTAKAAQQMTASITASIDDDKLPAVHADQIRIWAAGAGTLHGLMGVRNGNLVRFRHGPANPLPFDVIVVDEVSMMSLPLMARLLEAVPADATLVLVGDPRQLQSIETGAVLAQLWDLHAEVPHMTILERNRRQENRLPDGSVVLNAIGELAREMRVDRHDDISVARVIDLLVRADGKELVWIPVAPGVKPTAREIFETVEPHLEDFKEAKRIADMDAPDAAAELAAATRALAQVDGVRILCAHREGDWGVSGWNEVGHQISGVGRWRADPGRPLLVTRNDRSIGINNGDSGIVWGRSHPRAGLHVHRSAGQGGGTLRLFEIATLADIETAFATTVHKAQGSQYDTVVFVVPPPQSPLLQHELLYTAVTRAKKKLVLIGPAESIARALTTQTRRRSGLADRIRAARAGLLGGHSAPS